MRFIFDNNLPPSLARGMAELSKFEASVEKVVALREKFDQRAKDEEWVAALVSEGGWIIVSCDQFKKTTAERELIRRSGLTVFVLDPQWAGRQYWDQAAQLVRWWPKILEVAKLTSKAALRVPWRFTHRSTFEQIRA